MAATTAATWMRRRRVEPRAERTGTLAVIAVAPGSAYVGAELGMGDLTRCVGRRWVPAGRPGWPGRHRTPDR
jgi:hypothetical protein